MHLFFFEHAVDSIRGFEICIGSEGSATTQIFLKAESKSRFRLGSDGELRIEFRQIMIREFRFAQRPASPRVDAVCGGDFITELPLQKQFMETFFGYTLAADVVTQTVGECLGGSCLRWFS